MMNIVTLYRPVGLKELRLIIESGNTEFPPRLEWQPIFYPVLSQAYAEAIALDWNTHDAFSRYCGVVTRFNLREEHYLKYPVQNVGGEIHNELWVPAEELEAFNQNIVGKIEVVKAFFGVEFEMPIILYLDKHYLNIIIMKYNNRWLAERYNVNEKIKYLFFWGHKPSEDGSITQSCLSQWWVSPFIVDGVTYKTAEHWMMAGKARLFNDPSSLEKILQSNTPAEAKKLGRLVKDFNPDTWDREKFGIVVKGTFHKFSQHEEMKSFLLGTADKVLVEASPRDRIWGIGMGAGNASIENPLSWRGQNLLGYALMEARDQLQ